MRFSLFLLLASFVLGLQAQIVNPKKVRFGKFSAEELALETYAPDPDADAVVLFSDGVARMEYDISSKGLQLSTDHHQRIKILKGAGVDYATFTFRLSNSTTSSAREEIISIKGVTVNMVDGKPVETKLSKDGIFEEKITAGLDQVTITFPQVKEGSIIDLKYTYKTDYLMNIPTWYFQRSIPTDYSHYDAIFPEYFYYTVDMKGFGSGLLTESVVAETSNGSMMIPGNNKPLDFITRAYRWTAVEVPSLKSEPYAPIVSNYFFRVSFELGSVNFPGQLSTSYSQSWDDIVDFYRQFSDNRPYLKPRDEVAELIAAWTEGASSDTEKLSTIYEGVKNQVEWANGYSISAGETPGKLLELKSGNSADINYLLLSGLRAAGIEAYPVLVSTRNNGYLSLTRPSLIQFNHVIVAATLADGQTLLLDATRVDVPLPLLARHNLNDRGRLIKEESSEWISLGAPGSDKVALQLKLALATDGQLTGTAKYKASGYAALDFRRENDADETTSYLEKWTGQTFTDVEVSDFDDDYDDVSIEAKMDASAAVMNNGDLYYVSAIMATHYSENPFTAESRLFPVDLQVPQDYVYVMQLEIPESVTIEEIPESINFALPEAKGSYSLRFIEMNGNLQVIEKLSLKDPLFFAAEYAALKKFFDLVLEQQQATVVLKKS